MDEILTLLKAGKTPESIYQDALAAVDQMNREKNNKNLRITIDANLRSRYNDLKLEDGSYGNNYFDNDMYIMEIKVLDSMPLWLVKSLSDLKIYPISFFFFFFIYIKNKGSEVLCWQIF